MVSSGEDPNAFASGEMHKKQSPDNGKHMIQQVDDTGIDTSQNPEEVTPVKSEKSLQDPVVGLHISQLDKEGSISSITSGKVSLTPGTISSALLSCQSGRSPIIREKVSEDGYHWRKYGQKLVKGNEFIRSYYKCTHPSCLVKKQLERSHDGKISDIVHFGHHDHPKPELHLPQNVGLVLPVIEEKADKPLSIGKEEACSPHQLKSSTTSQISRVTSSEDVKDVVQESNRIKDEVHDDDIVPSKRQKKSIQNIESTHVDKLTASEPRVVLQTLSEVDIVNDGYRWRKYGQKMVKGNANPRSYYRCSSPGCPVKKHVERASHDPKVVITSYEGQHDHNMPPSRTITQNASGLNHNGDSGSKPEATDVAEAKSSSPYGNSKDLNSSFTCKPKAGNIGGLDAAIFSNEIQDKKSNAAEGNDATGTGTVVNSSPVSEGRSDQQNGDELRTEMKVNCTACSAQTITPGLESNPNEQHIKNAEPVQS